MEKGLSYDLETGQRTRMKIAIVVVVGICGILDSVKGQFGGFGGGGGGPLLGAISNVIPNGCPSPDPVRNFKLEEVPRIIEFSTLFSKICCHMARFLDRMSLALWASGL